MILNLKPIKYSLILFLLVLFALTTNLFSQASEKKSTKTIIQWKPVDKAESYKLEIKPEDKEEKKMNLSIKENEVFLDLKPGLYTYRVGAVNKFKKVKHWSKWLSLEVILSEPPVVEETSKYSFFIPEKEQEIVVKGKYFLEEIEVGLESSSEKFPLKNIRRISESEIRFLVNLEAISKPDSLRLMLKNPLEKITIKDNFIILEKKQPPKLPEVAEIKNMEEPPLFQEEAKAAEAREIAETAKTTGYTGSILPPLWRSSLIPGWGQVYKEEKVKGYILGGSVLLFLGSYFIFEAPKKNSISHSQDLSNVLFLLPGDANLIPAAIYLRNESIESRNKAQDELEKQQAVLGIAGAIYIYNVVDILWNRKAGEKPIVTKEETTGFYLNVGNQGKGSFQFGFSYRF